LSNVLINFDTAAVVTVSGNSAGAPELANIGHSDRDPAPFNLSVLINATAVSGTTPNLVAEVVWSHDGTNFFSAATPDTFTAITAVGGVVKQFPVKGRFARIKYTVTGTTPSFTLTVTGYAA
jgi:hypothetical protein